MLVRQPPPAVAPGGRESDVRGNRGRGTEGAAGAISESIYESQARIAVPAWVRAQPKARAQVDARACAGVKFT